MEPTAANARPGFGLPVNHLPLQRCATGIIDWAVYPFTVKELAMLNVMNALTEKQEWERKVFDDAIVLKWRQEALSIPDSKMTDAAFDWECIAELREKAENFGKNGWVSVLDGGSKVLKCEAVVSEALRQSLIDACRPLQDLPVHLRDMQPRQDNIVRNLIHPSLFPLVYGTTRALEDGQVPLNECVEFCGKGQVVDVPELPDDVRSRTVEWSRRFQWLPCDVQFGEHGTVRITSYINNLHPAEHAQLYSVIEKLIATTIPLWDQVLIQYRSEHERSSRRIDCEEENWDSPAPPDASEEDEPEEFTPREDDDPSYEFQDNLGYRGRRYATWYATRKVIHPDPPQFDTGDKSAWQSCDFDLRKTFADSGLQVIVKISSIELTPEKPEYKIGKWHLEGQLNEHIAATAIYYYDCENVTENTLEFRQALSQAWEMYGVNYEQGEFSGLEQIFGMDLDSGSEPCVQNLGSVTTRQGRVLVFPNTLQHRVGPLRLIDPSKPGHRRMLVLWLIDPQTKILSTALVPPQQKCWWATRLLETLQRFARLPTEVSEMIFDRVEDFPMSLETAEKLRLELMDERSRFNDQVTDHIEEASWNFCEH